jgi:hypothetical protein
MTADMMQNRKQASRGPEMMKQNPPECVLESPRHIREFYLLSMPGPCDNTHDTSGNKV